MGVTGLDCLGYVKPNVPHNFLGKSSKSVQLEAVTHVWVNLEFDRNILPGFTFSMNSSQLLFNVLQRM